MNKIKTAMVVAMLVASPALAQPSQHIDDHGGFDFVHLGLPLDVCLAGDMVEINKSFQ